MLIKAPGWNDGAKTGGERRRPERPGRRFPFSRMTTSRCSNGLRPLGGWIPALPCSTHADVFNVVGRWFVRSTTMTPTWPDHPRKLTLGFPRWSNHEWRAAQRVSCDHRFGTVHMNERMNQRRCSLVDEGRRIQTT